MKIHFKRKISKGSFIPEIDGLRFIAIASIVFYHINVFLSVKDVNLYSGNFNLAPINNFFAQGRIGVPLFFVISGFILSRPFAQMYIKRGDRIRLKSYFLRRLTRLEPPYLLIMTALFFGAVYVAKIISFQDGLLSYLASIFYAHNIIYGQFPLLHGVAWSLEIEVQFYILMPLLARLFLIRKTYIRRMLIIIGACVFLVLDFYESLPFRSILNYLEYFLIGILLADFYISKSTIMKKVKLENLLALLFFAMIWMLGMYEPIRVSTRVLVEMIQLLSIFLFYYLIFFHSALKLLTKPVITNIGGMCYSIYLLHYPIISIFGNPLVGQSFSNNVFLNRFVYGLILLTMVLLISSAYFLLIERPCMEKAWYKKILRRSSKST